MVFFSGSDTIGNATINIYNNISCYSCNILEGFNFTTGVRPIYVNSYFTTTPINEFLTMVNVIFLSLNILLLLYGNKITAKMRSLWINYSKRNIGKN